MSNSSKDKYAIVITTINYPTRAVVEIADDCHRLSADFILIGDSKSPKDFHQATAKYLNLESQVATGFDYAKAVPARHYARKNIGYLVAAKQGATIIIETDDDNIPRDEFWTPRDRIVRASLVNQAGWINVYRYFSNISIWPRGFPLQLVQREPPVLAESSVVLDCPIQQGLADENPDVDAVYRLVLPLPVDFDRRGPVALGNGAWCPFNSQNTTWWRDAFPLLYLPYHCSFRMTDIWRSFVAQRVAWENGWCVLFHNASVFQERNEHSLIGDFEDEVPGYLHNNNMALELQALTLERGVGAIPENMRRCYRLLIEKGWVGEGELVLLNAWLSDFSTL